MHWWMTWLFEKNKVWHIYVYAYICVQNTGTRGVGLTGLHHATPFNFLIMYTCTCVCMYVSVKTYIYIHMYMYMYIINICIYTYIYIYTYEDVYRSCILTLQGGEDGHESGDGRAEWGQRKARKEGKQYRAKTHKISALRRIAVFCSVLQCVVVCCSVLLCAAVCCSVLQWRCILLLLLETVI